MDRDDWIRPPKSGEVNNNTSVIIANDESKKTSTRTKTNRGIRRRSSLRVLGSSRTRSGCVFKTRASKATSQSNSSVSFSSFSSQPSFSSSSLTAKRRRQRPAIRGYDTIRSKKSSRPREKEQQQRREPALFFSSSSSSLSSLRTPPEEETIREEDVSLSLVENIEKDNAFFSPSFSVDELTRIFHEGGHHPDDDDDNTFDNHFFADLDSTLFSSPRYSFPPSFSHLWNDDKHHQILTTRQDAEKRAEKLPPGFALAGLPGFPNELHVFKGIPAPIGADVSAASLWGGGAGSNKRKLDSKDSVGAKKGSAASMKKAAKMINAGPKRPPSRGGAKTDTPRSKKQKLASHKSLPAHGGMFDIPDIMGSDIARYHSMNGGMHELPHDVLGLTEIERQQEYLLTQQKLRTPAQIQEEKEQKIALKKKLGEVQALVESLETRAVAVANERDKKFEKMHEDQQDYQQKDEMRKKHAAFRVITTQRTKSGAKSEFKEGFEVLRYRSLLDVVHRQCLAAVRQVMSHDWGGPFRMPVDAVALGLANYHTIITNPMDLGTIKKFIEDGGKYELAKEVHEDVELAFNNAMKFNAEGTDVHVMAKTLLALWHTKYEGIVAREKEVEEGLLLDRDACIAKAAAAASKLEYQTIQSECQTIMQALGLAQNQLSDLELKSIVLFKPMTADEKSALGDILKSLTAEDSEKARQILSDGPTKEYDRQILEAEAQHRQRLNANVGATSEWDNHPDERQMYVPTTATDITSRRLQRFTRMVARNKVAQKEGWCGNPLPETKKERVIEAFGGEKNASDLLVVSSPSAAVKKENEEEEEQKIEEEEENKKEETTPGGKGEGEGEEKKTTESDDGAETTTVNGNCGAGDDVATEDKKEPVVAPLEAAASVQIKQEKAGSGSDGATTIGQDPLHAFALTLGSDSKAVQEAQRRREEHEKHLEEHKQRLEEEKARLQEQQKQQEQERQRQIAIQQQLEREEMLKQRMLAQQKKASLTQFDSIMDGFDPGLSAGGNKKKKKKKPATPSNPTPAAPAPVPAGPNLHALPHPQLDDDFEQNLRGIDELGDADDFDFDALLGENIF